MRFPEFKDEWKPCTISDFGKIITGNTPSTKDTSLYGEDYLWASPADLGINKFITQTNTKLSKKGFEKTRHLPKNTILVTCIGSTIGKMGMTSREMATNQQINAIIVNNDVDCHFAYYALQSRFPKYMLSVAVQAVPIISKSNFENLCNYRPTTEEQKKIGALLSLIDKRIEIQRSAIEKLKSLMAGIYNQLFSQCNGVKLLLSDICTLRKGQQVNGEELCSYNEDGVLYYVMNGGTEPSGYYDRFNSETNTISISEGGNSCGYIQWNSRRFWAGGHCYTLCSIQNTIDAKYLYHYLKFKEKTIMDMRVGSGLPNIQKKDLERFQILVPKYEEQITLVKIFESINKKIDIESQLLVSYSIEKRFLLSKMFI